MLTTVFWIALVASIGILVMRFSTTDGWYTGHRIYAPGGDRSDASGGGRCLSPAWSPTRARRPRRPAPLDRTRLPADAKLVGLDLQPLRLFWRWPTRFSTGGSWRCAGGYAAQERNDRRGNQSRGLPGRRKSTTRSPRGAGA